MAMGELERDVMMQLWAADSPRSVREVHAALAAERDLAYTTVMTVLDRLARKQLVTRSQDGRAYRYSPAYSRDELAAQAMASALHDAGTDRDAALLRFVDSVSPAEAATLRAALDQVERARSTKTSRPAPARRRRRSDSR